MHVRYMSNKVYFVVIVALKMTGYLYCTLDNDCFCVCRVNDHLYLKVYQLAYL